MFHFFVFIVIQIARHQMTNESTAEEFFAKLMDGLCVYSSIDNRYGSVGGAYMVGALNL